MSGPHMKSSFAYESVIDYFSLLPDELFTFHILPQLNSFECHIFRHVASRYAGLKSAMSESDDYMQSNRDFRTLLHYCSSISNLSLYQWGLEAGYCPSDYDLMEVIRRDDVIFLSFLKSNRLWFGCSDSDIIKHAIDSVSLNTVEWLKNSSNIDASHIDRICILKKHRFLLLLRRGTGLVKIKRMVQLFGHSLDSLKNINDRFFENYSLEEISPIIDYLETITSPETVSESKIQDLRVGDSESKTGWRYALSIFVQTGTIEPRTNIPIRPLLITLSRNSLSLEQLKHIFVTWTFSKSLLEQLISVRRFGKYVPLQLYQYIHSIGYSVGIIQIYDFKGWNSHMVEWFYSIGGKISIMCSSSIGCSGNRALISALISAFLQQVSGNDIYKEVLRESLLSRQLILDGIPDFIIKNVES
jgi:hypothetical protein